MTELNAYGMRIVPPELFDGEHVALTPTAGGLPPMCSCGWTRHQDAAGKWYELADHLEAMAAAS